MATASFREDRTTFYGRALSGWWRTGRRLLRRIGSTHRVVGRWLVTFGRDAGNWIDDHFVGVWVAAGIPTFIAGLIWFVPIIAHLAPIWTGLAILVVAGLALPVAFLVWVLSWLLPALFAVLSFLAVIGIRLLVLAGMLVSGVLTLGLMGVELLLLIPLGVLWLGHLWYLAHWRIFYTCPSGRCSYRGQPLHVCPNCGKEYPRLRPNLFGHLYHICGRCGTRLPTLDRLGRGRLERRCAGIRPDGSFCAEPLPRSSPEWLVAVVGAGSSGKTCYGLMLVRELLRGVGHNPGLLRAEIAEERDREEWGFDAPQLEHGRAPAKTQTGIPRAVLLRLSHGRRKRLLYLYDASGEEYVRIDTFARHRQIEHIDGIILLVDPLGLPGLREEFSPADLPAHAAAEHLEDIADATINALDRMRGNGGGGHRDVRVAVVISKADVPPVCRRLGDIAQRAPGSRDCRQAIFDWDGGGALNMLETHVEQVRYFACSALGREAGERDGEPFESHGIIEPLTWILG